MTDGAAGQWCRYKFNAAVVRIDHYLKSRADKLRMKKEIMQRYVTYSCLLPLLLAVNASANPILEVPSSGLTVLGPSALTNAHRHFRRGRPVEAAAGVQVTGTVPAGNTDAKPAQNEVTAAIDALEGLGAGSTPGSNSGDQRLGPDGNPSTSTMGITGTNTFDGHGDDSDFFRENTHDRTDALGTMEPASTVPEPGSFWLVGLCLAGLAIQRKLSRA